MVSRRRKKELKNLRGNAEELWKDQQAVLNQANVVWGQAKTQAGHLTREEVVPRVQTAYAERVAPTVDRGVSAGKSAASAVLATAVPAVTSAAAAGAALSGTAKDRLSSARDTAKDTASTGAKKAKARGNAALKAASTVAAVKAVKKAAPAKKRGLGVGGVIGITIGVLALVGIAYAVWQTLRADDDLWVADDEADTTGTPTA